MHLPETQQCCHLLAFSLLCYTFIQKPIKPIKPIKLLRDPHENPLYRLFSTYKTYKIQFT